MCKSTNIVESLHALRRKFADKRLNFSKQYQTRANISIFSRYIVNYGELILKKMKLTEDWSHYKWFTIHAGLEQKLLNQKLKKNKQYMANRERWKHHKYSDANSKEFKYASTLKEKMENLEDENHPLICQVCGKEFKSAAWKLKHQQKCEAKHVQKQEYDIALPECYVNVPAITIYWLKKHNPQLILENDQLNNNDNNNNNPQEHSSEDDVSEPEEDESDYEILQDNTPVLDTENNQEANENEFIEQMKMKHKKKFFLID